MRPGRRPRVEDQLRRLGIPGHAVCRPLRTEISYDLRPGETVSLIARCGEKGTGRWLRALSRRTPEGVAEVLLAGGREGCSFGDKPCRSLPREGAWAPEPERRRPGGHGGTICCSWSRG